jgi:hypothetical protein
MALPRLPVTVVLNGDGCNLYGAVTTDQQSGKVFFAEFDTTTDGVSVISFDSQTLQQIEKISVPMPTELSGIGGPIRLVHLANANTVAFVTDGGYVVALTGPMFGP